MTVQASPGSATTKPVVTVVVVSDYESGTEVGWQILRNTLAGLARQDLGEPIEVLLCENRAIAAGMPSDIAAIVPGTKVLTCDAQTSFALKNEGARHATAEMVAFVDADVMPEPGWLRHLVTALTRNPDAAVASPRTLHPAGGFVARATSLLLRSHIDTGRPGPTRYLAVHSALYRRTAVLAHPFHPTAGPFSGRLQSEAILNSGGILLFEPESRVIHVYDGWQACADVARNNGYGTVITRLIDRSQPFAWLTRLGRASIPFFVIGKTVDSFRDSFRCYRDYGLSAAQLPALLVLAAVLRALEVPGMVRAFARQELAGTAYR